MPDFSQTIYHYYKVLDNLNQLAAFESLRIQTKPFDQQLPLYTICKPSWENSNLLTNYAVSTTSTLFQTLSLYQFSFYAHDQHTLPWLKPIFTQLMEWKEFQLKQKRWLARYSSLTAPNYNMIRKLYHIYQNSFFSGLSDSKMNPHPLTFFTANLHIHQNFFFLSPTYNWWLKRLSNSQLLTHNLWIWQLTQSAPHMTHSKSILKNLLNNDFNHEWNNLFYNPFVVNSVTDQSVSSTSTTLNSKDIFLLQISSFTFLTDLTEYLTLLQLWDWQNSKNTIFLTNFDVAVDDFFCVSPDQWATAYPVFYRFKMLTPISTKNLSPSFSALFILRKFNA